MHLIDRYELSIPGHMRLVDARSALNYLERFVNGSEGPVDCEVLAEKLEPLIEALNDAADNARPVNGDEAFELQACQWGYIALSPRERNVLQQIRSSNQEGQEEIFQMITEIQARKPLLDPQ